MTSSRVLQRLRTHLRATARRYARLLYKRHISAMINRVNTINGRRYGDDPAVFGWNLMNEPRSTLDLRVEERVSTDTSLSYNVSSNSGDSLQARRRRRSIDSLSLHLVMPVVSPTLSGHADRGTNDHHTILIRSIRTR